MNKNTSISILLAALIALAGCSKQAEEPKAATPAQVTKAESQRAEPPKPAPKRKVPVDQIDFSKYPGVIRAAAFGYYYGLTPEQIEEAGIDLEAGQIDGNLSVYETKSAPLAWDGAEEYLLVFSKNSLLKVVGIGRTITEDSTGSKGKEAHKELVTALTEKYGKPNFSMHKVGLRLYQERDEFYQCLAYDGCGIWIDTFKTPDRHISVQMNGLGRSKGFIDLTYEAQPEWDQAVDQNKMTKKEATKRGL